MLMEVTFLTKITIYTQPDCPPCEIAKLFLKEYGFDFEVKDIKQHQQYKYVVTAIDRMKNESKPSDSRSANEEI